MSGTLIKIFFIEENKAKDILRKNKETKDIIADTVKLNGKIYACVACDLNNSGEAFPDLCLKKRKTFEELQETSEDSIELY